jgi:hypothetical protein
MASELDSALQEGLQAMESLQSDAGTAPQITVGGYDWPCTRGTKKKGQVQQNGGYTFVFDYVVHIRKNAIGSDGSTLFSSLTVSPESLVTDQSESLRVAFMDEGQGAYTALYLVDPARQ